MGVCVCVRVCKHSAASKSTRSNESHSTWTGPKLRSIFFWPKFWLPVANIPPLVEPKCWQYECCHIHAPQCALASTVRLEIGPDPADAIADGNLLKIKQGRKILNMFWQCPRVFINQSLRCCLFSACRGRMFRGEVINQLQVCFHKAGKQLIRC